MGNEFVCNFTQLLSDHVFVSFFSGHLRCLKKLDEADDLCESTVQEVLAVHLFGPLTMENSRIRVDSSRYKGKADTKCRFCHIKVPTDNTSFGKYKHMSPAKRRGRHTFSSHVI